MVTDAERDTGFVLPIRAAERLSNLRFRFLPEFFAGWSELKAQRDVLSDRVKNLEQQATTATEIAERRKQQNEALQKNLEETSRVLKRKNFAVKFYRSTTILLAVATATLLIAH
jgi:hypothetical protein